MFNTHNEFLNVSNFSEMYEIGLEVENKIQKKQSGQYYTPNDVAKTMAN
ncbi:N-6 DNA methylase [Lactobacillus crispatus]|nr:N-6 DNA methylase [Lactobacillus crispatus]